ncbi:hypothetical protein [Deinococcus roseus]|uniref:Intracellular proteinase inhibitor BsuPI domain-containing protein n=1 Tax=Deinococcus roseus TaxID=392414 RepID=A0ABQ2CY65_9DEIO|nr:hypothetical protein [Deinococcus roseus]GGJ32589.1 hypothetical protein GCM10008938_18490 [Deinococcus roseus]
MNTPHPAFCTAISFCLLLNVPAFAQSELQSQPSKTSVYSIIQTPSSIPARQNLPLRITVVNNGQHILEARYSGCFLRYQVLDLHRRVVAQSSREGCLKTSGGFSILNQSDYPFLETFLVDTQKLNKGHYQLQVTLQVQGQLGTEGITRIASKPLKFSVI